MPSKTITTTYCSEMKFVGGPNKSSGWSHVQEPNVNQPSYYAPILHEFTSFHQRLQEQGLAPTTYSGDLNPPFILTNSYTDNVPHYPQYSPIVEHHQTPTHPPKGKHKFYHIAHKVDDIKNKDCEHAKKPIVEIDFKWPNIKHDSNSDKVHATATNIVQGLNETLNKIGEQVEVKKAAIKQLVDKSVDNIDKTAGGVYQQIENESSKLIDRINKKLKTIEKQLERLKFGWVKSVTELEEDEDEDNEDDMTRAIDDNQSTKVNVVHSEIGKKLRSLELLDLDAELRSDLKTSISDAVRKAQDKFNKLIDDQVAKINNKISYVTEKFEDAFKKFNDALALLPRPTLRPQPTKIFTPPTYETKYTTIVWKPKSTTPIPDIPTKNKKTTPEYYKYTVPTPKYKAVEIPPSDNTLMTDLNRMDAYVETLEIVDNARDDAAKKIDEKVEEIDEAKAEVDTGKSLDDLQSQVLETVRDTLKSGDEESEDSQSEVVENPDDKLKSDADGKVVEEALTEELRNGDKSLDENVADEKSQINTQEKNSDELAKIVNEFDGDEYEATTSSQNFDDAVKSLEIDEDGGFDEMRAIEDGSGDAVVDIDEEFPTQSGNLRFDELEVIQLIPVIIEQLKAGHVSESERVSLEKIFGDLWALIVAEAERVEGEDMNPLLKTILQSEEVRLAKRDITKQIGNDIFKNSVRRVYRGDDRKAPKPYISIDDDRKTMSPSQRLLSMVAAIVHKANVMEKEKTRLRQKEKRRLQKKKALKNPLGIVTAKKPRHRFVDRILGMNRMKRSLIKFGSDLADMRSLLEQVNQANNSEEDEEEEEIGEKFSTNDEYVNDDYYYDDDYQVAFDTSDYPLDENSRKLFDDYENGSVNEFIHLAKQRDRREQANLDDSYEDDGDDY